MDAIAHRTADNPKFLEPIIIRELGRVSEKPEVIDFPTIKTTAGQCHHPKRRPRTSDATHRMKKAEPDVPALGRKLRRTEAAGVANVEMQRKSTGNVKITNVSPPNCQKTTIYTCRIYSQRMRAVAWKNHTTIAKQILSMAKVS